MTSSTMHENFNLQIYEKTLKTGLQHEYNFLGFECLKGSVDTGQKLCLLRHDIDADMQAALAMAKVEHLLGVKATYFFMLRSPVYNFMSRANNDFAKEIQSLGHHIGLHYDHAYYASSHKSHTEWMEMEASVVEDLLDTQIDVISFHQPGPDVLQGQVQMGRFLNTYTDPMDKGFHYMSDSNRQWKDEDALSVFEQARQKHIQLLIHPFWWVYGHCMTTQEAWDHTISINIGHMQKQLIETERAYGQKRDIFYKTGSHDEAA